MNRSIRITQKRRMMKDYNKAFEESFGEHNSINSLQKHSIFFSVLVVILFIGLIAYSLVGM